MKSKIFNIALLMALGVLIVIGCSSTKYEGTYTGIMPCADCSGIDTEITINDGKYIVKRTYLGTENMEQNMFVESGSYKWDGERSILTFDNDPEQQYLVRGNTLVALDQDGKEVTGDLADLYVLKKK